MSSNRAALITKLQKVLKKHYKPASPPADRTTLEHLLFACCLENSSLEAAEEAFARLQENYFDWNEVRVTTVKELSEVLGSLQDVPEAATRLKKTLQSVFETHYSYDLEFLKKLNLGKAVKELEKLDGVDPFAIAYVTQSALGGHAIPTGKGVLDAFVVLGIISPAEASKQRVPGLERAVAKSKGVEFGSLIHQLGVDYYGSAFGARIRGLLLEINPDAKDRLPKRPIRKAEASAEKPKKATRGGKAKPAKKATAKPASASTKKKVSSKKAPSTRMSKKKPR